MLLWSFVCDSNAYISKNYLWMFCLHSRFVFHSMPLVLWTVLLMLYKRYRGRSLPYLIMLSVWLHFLCPGAGLIVSYLSLLLVSGQSLLLIPFKQSVTLSTWTVSVTRFTSTVCYSFHLHSLCYSFHLKSLLLIQSDKSPLFVCGHWPASVVPSISPVFVTRIWPVCDHWPASTFPFPSVRRTSRAPSASWWRKMEWWLASSTGRRRRATQRSAPHQRWGLFRFCNSILITIMAIPLNSIIRRERSVP